MYNYFKSNVFTLVSQVLQVLDVVFKFSVLVYDLTLFLRTHSVNNSLRK